MHRICSQACSLHSASHIGAVRKQYHFRKRDKDFDAWDVDRLVAASKDLPVLQLALTAIAELDETYWYDGQEDKPTCRNIAQHMKLCQAADLSYPIILCADGRVMDGMHRVTKAYMQGHATIKAVRFEATPAPDYKNVRAEDLPY